MSWLKWEFGRTSPYNYEKLTIFSSKWLGCDCYLLYFPEGSSIDWHTDPVPEGLSHRRLNVFLRKPFSGGRIMTKLVIPSVAGKPAKLTLRHKGRFHYMQPDKTLHAVEQVERGWGLILSFGWVRKLK